jgi:predicted kinase
MKAIILRGGSGAGKSTWIRKNIPSEESTIFSADSFFTEGDGTYNFDPAKLKEAHRTCLLGFIDRCRFIHKSGDHKAGTGLIPYETLVVDNTNSRLSEFIPYAEVASAYGLEVLIVTFIYDPVAAFKRNTHGTPLTKCMEQHQRLQVNTPLIPYWVKHEYALWDETWPWASSSGDN